MNHFPGRPPVTVTIITLNERDNLPAAIESVRWADEILVVDSGSSDGTVELAKNLGARVLTQAWRGYGQQKNFAQENATHDWVLNIDADERISDELRAQIQERLSRIGAGDCDTKGFCFPRKTHYLGRWIQHGGWYPDIITRMADRRFARWSEPAVHEKLEVNGSVERLTAPINHFTFSSIAEQVTTNVRYARQGAEVLKKRGKHPSLSLLVIKPVGKFIETYVLKRGFLDGLPGFIISINAAHSMFMKYAFLLEDKIRHLPEKP